MADGKLEDLFTAQTAVIESMNKRYKEALEGHIDGFEAIIKRQTEELETRHKEFMQAMEEKLNIGEIQKDFASLRKLNVIATELSKLTEDPVKAEELNDLLQKIQEEIGKIEVNENRGGGGLFGFGRR